MKKVKLIGISKNETRLIITIKKEKETFSNFCYKLLEILNIDIDHEYYLPESFLLTDNLIDFNDNKKLFIFSGTKFSTILILSNSKTQLKLLSDLKPYFNLDEFKK